MGSIGALMQMRNLASEVQLRQAQAQQAAAQTQNIQAQEEDRQRKLRDQNQLQSIMQDTFGANPNATWNDVFTRARKEGTISPDSIMAAETNYGKQVQETAKARTEELKAHSEGIGQLAPAMQSIFDLDPGERNAAYQTFRNASMGSPDQTIRAIATNELPQQWDDQQAKQVIAKGLGIKNLIDAALAKQKEQREAQAKTLTTDQGIMGYNPDTGKYDVPMGQPPETKRTAAATVTTDQGIFQWNPETQAYDKKVGDAPTKTGANVPAEQQFLDEYRKLHPGATVAEGIKAYKQATETPEKPLRQLVEVPGEGGTSTVQEVRAGSKVPTGAMTIAAAGAASAKAEAEKKPVESALQYGQDYLNRGVYTGSGDEALQEKFFELAKPSTGFRMTQPQMAMLQQSRGWMNSIEAKFRHATTGTWFSNEQRQQIVNTMNDLAQAKLKTGTGATAPTGGGSFQQTKTDQNGKKWGWSPGMTQWQQVP